MKVNKQNIIDKLMEENDLDAMLIYSVENRFWYSQFPSSYGFLVVLKNGSYLFLDGRYVTSAKETVKNCKIIDLVSNFSNIKSLLEKNNIKKLGFEEEYVSYDLFKKFKNTFDQVDLVPVQVKTIRMIKDDSEIEKIKKACKITDNAFMEVIKNVKSGMKETDIEKIIWNSFKDQGADKESFDTIVASGYRAAYPHGRASSKIIAQNDVVVIDFGAFFKGYCSDMTRTIAFGNPDNKLREIYKIVYDAQQASIAAMKPGVLAKEIDSISRNYIAEKGYGKYFTHGFGHGMGIEIHENPYENPTSNEVLKAGMVVSAEPGIYIPGLGGVRIEDDVLITESGHERLTKSKTDKLIIIK